MSGLVEECCCSGDNRGGGGIDVFASGMPPAMEVSGTPKLRGGRSAFSVEGWYALEVCSCLLNDWRYG
jgi:hypothetical protein